MNRTCESKSDGEEVDALLVELDRAGEVDLQDEDRERPRPAARACSTPRIATLPGGISMITPSDRLTSVGAPQPSFAIGPIRNVPCCGGKIARRSLMMRGAFATTSCGNMMLVDRAGADAVHQRLEEHRAVEAEQPADGDQREAEAELDARRRTRP